MSGNTHIVRGQFESDAQRAAFLGLLGAAADLLAARLEAESPAFVAGRVGEVALAAAREELARAVRGEPVPESTARMVAAAAHHVGGRGLVFTPAELAEAEAGVRAAREAVYRPRAESITARDAWWRQVNATRKGGPSL